MIYTITLNPTLDRTLWVEKIEPDDSNRIEREERYAGGKGIDVSKVLKTLGVRNKALGFIGGFAGEELEGRLLNEGITNDFIGISGETRTNVIVNNMSTGAQTVFSARGPEINSHALMQLIHKVENLDRAEGVAACIGSDFVKVNYPGKEGHESKQIFKEAVLAAGRTKVVCAGGSSVDVESFLQRLHDQIVISGASGNATGRNIHQKPLEEAVRMCNAIYAITVDGKTVKEALKIYQS